MYGKVRFCRKNISGLVISGLPRIKLEGCHSDGFSFRLITQIYGKMFIPPCKILKKINPPGFKTISRAYAYNIMRVSTVCRLIFHLFHLSGPEGPRFTNLLLPIMKTSSRLFPVKWLVGLVLLCFGACSLASCGSLHTYGGIEHCYDYDFDGGHHHHGDKEWRKYQKKRYKAYKKAQKKRYKEYKKYHKHHHHHDD